MSLLHAAIGFFAGTFVGLGLSVLYIRWKIRSQLGAMQQQMDSMFEATEAMNDSFDDIEEADFEEKEEE
ncbi:MAG: hypothetical protein H8Z69_01360 [Nanohaloarchaea archaeon]|nr:hypothetical protein [Candidatus Nanohaloarchaea archaeon]